MALILADRVQQTGTANTTVSFTLSGSVTGFQTFATVGNGNTTYYSSYDSSGNWETGLGTYSTTGPTLTRTTIYASSNANTAVTFSGSVTVFVTYPSGRSVNLDASGNATSLGTPASFVGTNITGTAASLSIGGNAATATTATSATSATTATTATTANALNTGNSYSGVNFTASGYFSGPGTNLTGTAASLSIGGNAATATSATSATSATTAGGLTGTPNITVGTVNGTTITASTQFVGPGNGLTGTASSFTAGLASNLTGTPNITVGTVSGTTITASTQFSGPGTGLTGTAASLSIGGSAASATTASTANALNTSNSYTVAGLTSTQPITASTTPFFINGLTVSSNYTLAGSQGAMSVGPITINTGVVVTISTGSRWVVL